MSITQLPALVPERLGQPCWVPESIARAIPHVAQLDEARSHYFLASHTPIRGLRDVRTDATLDEERLFASVTDPSFADVLALVHGEPGTGKSHLIHWLNLRLRYALESGQLRDVVPVLVQRRSGSLRDALDQLVQQLPPEFGQYLDPVRQAIGTISLETARQELGNKLRLELGVRREERGRPRITGDLRNLAETVGSPGFRDWLCREGGPVDRNVRRLTEPSAVEDRDGFPPFTERDFRVEDARFRRNNTRDVENLVNDFEEESELREQAAAYFNEVLPDAVREMTGLSGSTLRDIFDRIRADLRVQGRTLAVFVEDVSVMSVLDQDIVNIFEPQGRDDLCRTIGVVGLTEPGYRKLRDNQKQRATHTIEVGAGAGTEWRGGDPQAAARFTARYLNTMRLREEGTRELAELRRTGGAPAQSACDRCPVRAECHEVFGAVDVEGATVGTFPFSAAAPQRLIENLDDRDPESGIRRNARGLLMHVVRPVVSAHADLEHGSFPRMDLAVLPLALPFWASFEERFCGDWRHDEKARLKLLAQFWIWAEDADAAAAQLQPLLPPFVFPPFTAVVAPGAARPLPVDGDPGHTPAPSAPGSTPSAPASRLAQLLGDLDQWLAGGELRFAKDARDSLAKLIREGVRWEDQVEVPSRVWRRAMAGYEWVDIEGMRTLRKNPSAFSIRFERSPETRALIEALAQFEGAGGRSWDFPDGETHKRRVAGWLRRNRAHIVGALHPRDGVDPAAPLRWAIQFLATAAVSARGSRLPPEADRRISALLSPPPDSPRSALSPQWKKSLDLLRAHHARVRDFVLDEVNVPQGTGGINFIDPFPLLQAVTRFEEAPGIDGLDPACFEGFWQSRYAALEPLEKFERLEGMAAVERSMLGDAVEQVTSTLGVWDCSSEPGPGVQAFFAELAEVRAAQAQSEVLGVQLFPDLGPRQLTDLVRRWARGVDDAAAAVRSEAWLDALVLDPAALVELRTRLDEAVRYLGILETYVREELEDIRHAGDPEEVAAALIDTLERIARADAPAGVEVG